MGCGLWAIPITEQPIAHSHLATIRRCRLVQYPPQLSFFLAGEGRRAGSLRLKERAEKDAVVELGTSGAEVAGVRLPAQMLGLKDLCFSFTTPLA
jgi:hypothetical protein